MHCNGGVLEYIRNNSEKEKNSFTTLQVEEVLPVTNFTYFNYDLLLWFMHVQYNSGSNVATMVVFVLSWLHVCYHFQIYHIGGLMLCCLSMYCLISTDDHVQVVSYVKCVCKI